MEKEMDFPRRLDRLKSAISNTRGLYDLATIAEAVGVSKRYLQFVLNGDKKLTPEFDRKVRKYLLKARQLEEQIQQTA